MVERLVACADADLGAVEAENLRDEPRHVLQSLSSGGPESGIVTTILDELDQQPIFDESLQCGALFIRRAASLELSNHFAVNRAAMKTRIQSYSKKV